MERGNGSVVVNYGARVLVETDAGALLRCAVRGRRLRPVCGDRVEWEQADDTAVVTRITGREHVLERADRRGGAAAIASHLDRILVVVAPVPEPEPVLIDRYLVMAELGGIPASLLLNKADLWPPGFAGRFDRFAQAGYATWRCSAHTGDGLDALQGELTGRTTILVGQSGTGKSSLLNKLIPDLALQTGVLSERSGEGRHTTTATTRYRMPGGGALVDSPGVREFWLPRMPAPDLIRGFREIARAGERCRFRNCQHVQEPDCAVRAAVAAGDIGARRHRSYLQLLRTVC